MSVNEYHRNKMVCFVYRAKKGEFIFICILHQGVLLCWEWKRNITSSSCSWSRMGSNLDKRAVFSNSWLQPSLIPEGARIQSEHTDIYQHPHTRRFNVAAGFEWFGYRYRREDRVCVCVCTVSSMHTRTHTHARSVPPGVLWSPARGLANKSVCTHDVCSLQILAAVKRLSSSPALSRSGTQGLLSGSLIPLWFILVLFPFPECRSACLTVSKSWPLPMFYQ